MKHIAVADVSDRLPALLDDVARGEEITILRDGKPMARLIAAVTKPAVETEFTPEEIEIRRAALKRIRENAREIGFKASQEEIKSWIEEGRR